MIVLDGMEGGTAASQEVFIEHVGIPILAAIPEAVRSLQELGMHREVQLIVSGESATAPMPPRRSPWGPTLCRSAWPPWSRSETTPTTSSPNTSRSAPLPASTTTGTRADPVGISTQDDELASRFDAELGGRRIANYLRAMVLEAQTLARACGKSHVHNLEPEDMVALTFEASAMAKVPVAGTSWIPGQEQKS